MVYVIKEYTMATTLYYVQGDTLPQIKLTLTDEVTQAARNLTNKIVSLHAKPATGSGVRFSRIADFTSTQDRLDGICYINWAAGELNRAPGNYTAEIEIYDTSTTGRETIYEVFTIVIREDIGDIGPPYPSPPSPSPPPIGPDPTV